MKVNVQRIFGPWATGFTLDKHTVSSTYLGDDEHGRPKFDTVRTEVGEALFQLKYRGDKFKAEILAEQIVGSLWRIFSGVSFIVPMPSSKVRMVQPVHLVAQAIAVRTGVKFLDSLLIKATATPQMKDIGVKAERVSALQGAYRAVDVIRSEPCDVLLIDDLYDTGSSLEGATRALLQYGKIRRVFVAAVTRKRP